MDRWGWLVGSRSPVVVGGIVGFWLPIVLSVAVEGVRALLGAETGEQTLLFAFLLFAPWGAVVGIVVALATRRAWTKAQGSDRPPRLPARGAVVGAVVGAALPALAIPARVLSLGRNPFDRALLVAVLAAAGGGALLGWVVAPLVRRLLRERSRTGEAEAVDVS